MDHQDEPDVTLQDRQGNPIRLHYSERQAYDRLLSEAEVDAGASAAEHVDDQLAIIERLGRMRYAISGGRAGDLVRRLSRSPGMVRLAAAGGTVLEPVDVEPLTDEERVTRRAASSLFTAAMDRLADALEDADGDLASEQSELTVAARVHHYADAAARIASLTPAPAAAAPPLDTVLAEAWNAMQELTFETSAMETYTPTTADADALVARLRVRLG